MELFRLMATIGLDASEYEKGINSAKKSATDYRRDVMSLAQEFKKSGMTMSDAMKKAYQEIDKSAYDMSKNVSDSIDDVEKNTESTTSKQKGLWKRLFSSVETDAGSAFNSISAKTIAMGNLIASGIEKAVSAVGRLGSSAVTAAADIAAENAQFTAAFGELEAAATGTFNSIAKDTGVLSTRLRNVGTKAFSQFKGAGLDAVSALSSMDTYTRLAADAAAYYDMSLEDADERLRSFLRGNTEAGDSIGLFTSETQRNNKALEVYGQKWLDLTEAQKQMLMLDIANEIYEQSGAIGQAERESAEWSNVVGNLKEAWRQALGVFGTPFEERITPLIQKLTEFLSDETVSMRIGLLASGLASIADQAFDGAINFIDELISWSNGEGDSASMDALTNALSLLSGLASGLFKGPIELLKMLFSNPEGDAMESISLFLSDLTTFVESDTVSVILGFLGSAFLAINLFHSPLRLIAAGLALIVTNWKDIREWTINAWESLKDFIATHIPEGFLSAVVTVLETISSLVNGIKNAWNSFVNSLNSTNAATGIAKIDQALKQEGVLGAIGAGVDYVWGGGASAASSNSGFGGGSASSSGGSGRGFATGLDYVPYDNFEARLHFGEAVLNRADASAWRAGTGAQIDAGTLAAAVGEAVRAALEGMNVNIDGQRAGSLLAEPVSRSIAQMARNRRYQMG